MDRISMTGVSRRSDKRVENPQMDAVVRFDEKTTSATIKDISRVGLRFRSPEQYRKGDKLQFELRCSQLNDNVPVTLKGKVQNEYPSGDPDIHEYGIKFCRPAQWHDMNMIHDYVYACGKLMSSKRSV